MATAPAPGSQPELEQERQRERPPQWLSDESRDQLKRLWLNGLDADAIAELLNAPSRGAVLKLAGRLKLPARARTKSGRLVPKVLNPQFDDVSANELEPVSPRNQADIRRCLRCGKDFLSTWVGNRRCPECSVNDSSGDEYVLLTPSSRSGRHGL